MRDIHQEGVPGGGEGGRLRNEGKEEVS